MHRILASASLMLIAIGSASAADEKQAKILLFTKSSGFEHSVIKLNKDGTPCLVEKTLAELGAKNHFTIVHTKDGGVFTAEKLKEYDAFAFYTTGDLTTAGTDKNPPMSPEGKQALFDAIKAGKGFVGFHSASDTFHAASGAHSYVVDPVPDPYAVMLGAEFIMHGAQQKTKAITIDPKFPGIEGFKDATELQEEWYSLKQFPKDLHVLQVLDTSTMKGNMYERGNYPVTWIHPYGTGKVFYTAMGHRDDVWTNPIYQQLIIGGIDYALGRVKVDDSPNIEKAAPKYADVPPPPPPKAK
jgi:type 1 glutamine amidotransferase